MKSITLVTYPGGGMKVARALQARGIATVSVHRARGSAVGDPAGQRGFPNQFEKDMLTVIVDDSIADEVFELVFEAADVNRPYGGFVYMAKLGRGSEYRLPEIPRKET
jgi:nitrogen regulatory protein PII